ncbi:hypothetical protein VFPPC_15153 [Pochonia chlamydosporia 170]|uniref:Uncharacterized protein n=1 Tax=Pochonia chlamydosporia 170 TaxID=1380566 RepID=A0A179G5S0_METCM|nr:hypothetical protein VFPPC_15153 [Pochonia chlamydosporia 170]OAQ72519.1 hypothetical protein VFPPC_15153 [Pochonia chlamydosporia 170]
MHLSTDICKCDTSVLSNKYTRHFHVTADVMSRVRECDPRMRMDNVDNAASRLNRWQSAEQSCHG